MNVTRQSWLAEHEVPDSKDNARARKLIVEDQAIGRARSMAKAIRTKDKLVRRAKAMCKMWYEHGSETTLTGEQFLEGIWSPFQEALENYEFNDTEIRMIKRYGFDRGKRLDLI